MKTLPTLTLCASLATLLSGCAGAAWATNQNEGPRNVIQSGFPVVEVKLNGQGPFLFAVDSGSAACIVSPKVAEKLGLLQGAGSVQEAPKTTNVMAAPGGVIRNLEVGGVSAQGVPVAVMELPRLARASRGSDTVLDGYLGNYFLRDFRVTVDYAHHAVAFERTVAVAQPVPDVFGPAKK